MSTSFVIHEI